MVLANFFFFATLQTQCHVKNSCDLGTCDRGKPTWKRGPLEMLGATIAFLTAASAFAANDLRDARIAAVPYRVSRYEKAGRGKGLIGVRCTPHLQVALLHGAATFTSTPAHVHQTLFSLLCLASSPFCITPQFSIPQYTLSPLLVSHGVCRDTTPGSKVTRVDQWEEAMDFDGYQVSSLYFPLSKILQYTVVIIELHDHLWSIRLFSIRLSMRFYALSSTQNEL